MANFCIYNHTKGAFMTIRGSKLILNELIEIEEKIIKMKKLAKLWGVEVEDELLAQKIIENILNNKD